MTALENSIADSMEESMQPYISSDEYQLPKAAINQKIVEFRNGLTEAQQKDFNLLMNMMNDCGDARYHTTLSKSASDHREGDNIALQIIRDML